MKKVLDANQTEINYFWNLYHNNTGFQGDGNYRVEQKGKRTIVYDYIRN